MATRKATTTSVQVGVKLLNDFAKLPTRGSEEAACYDIVLPDDVYIAPHSTKAVGTGLAFNIPKGYRLDMFLRSGVAAKTMVRLANGVGKVDSDYTGEVKMLLTNEGGTPARFYRGDRVCQFEINKVTDIELSETSELKATERADGGMGSTGK